MVPCIIAALTAAGALYVAFILRDILRHRAETRAERGKVPALAALFPAVWFLASLGVSDLALLVPVYRRFRLVDDGRLPGTLLAGGVVNSVIIAVFYLTGARVEIATLLLCTVAEAAGAALGVRIVSRLRGSVIRVLMCCAMLTSLLIIILKIFFSGGAYGTATGLTGAQFALALPVMFALGMLNMVGFGMKAPSMAMFMLMGMDSVSVLTLVLTVGTVGALVGGVQFVRAARYQRKVALMGMSTGFIGILAAMFFVKAIDPGVLQWVMVAVISYAAWTMIKSPKPASSGDKGSSA